MWFPIPLGLALIIWGLLYGIFIFLAVLNFKYIAKRRGAWLIIAVPIFFMIGIGCIGIGYVVRNYLLVAGTVGYVVGALLFLMGIFIIIKEIAERSERKDKSRGGQK